MSRESRGKSGRDQRGGGRDGDVGEPECCHGKARTGFAECFLFLVADTVSL